MCPPASLPATQLTPLGHHRVSGWTPVLYKSFLLAIYLTHGSIYMSTLLSQHIPPFPSSTVFKSPFSTLYLYSYPENRFISTIFLGSIYMRNI